MIQFSDLHNGARVSGLSVTGPVRVIATEPAGSSSYWVYFIGENGAPERKLIYSSQLQDLDLASEPEWTFHGDGAKFRLAMEAERIRLSHLFDPYMAVSSSAVQPLPHQIAAVYQEMLPRLPLRYVLADDPGAGKTIMTGLLIKELKARGALQRCLIVVPGSLAEQWRDELAEKFGLHFALLSSDAQYSAASGNPFNDNPLLIARLDVLVRNSVLRDLLRSSAWDLIVCDEAHKMSATRSARKINRTKRYDLGTELAGLTEHFLLLTATPHNGKEADFQLFMSLIDPDRFDVGPASKVEPVDVSDVMRRLVKEELLRFDGTPLFPKRVVQTRKYSLSPEEHDLYAAVTQYVRQEFNRAERLKENKRNAVGFALTLLQRRLASSPEAIYRSLVRRRDRLQSRLEASRLGTDFEAPENGVWKYDDDDDFSSAELEEQNEEMITAASAAASEAELAAEIETLNRLAEQADAVRASGTDRKWQELSELLTSPELTREDGTREKLIIFTEHRDTINYLQDRIAELLGSDDAIVTIHGGLDRRRRKNVEAEFKNNPEVQILLATDAAGEGINLQVSHLMVNYDMPWNPNRIEQRFGRVHRIGQEHVCYLWNLVSAETREGQVFDLLLDKIAQQQASLPGNVFDILGKVEWSGRSLRQLLIEAIRADSAQTVEERVLPVLNSALDPKRLRELMEKEALVHDFLDEQSVREVREAMERAAARRLQPHYVQSFFQEAMRDLGGRMVPRGNGCYEIVRLPRAVQQSDKAVPVASRYSTVCFDRESVPEGEAEGTELVSPGSPLLELVLSSIADRYRDVLKTGAVLIDESDRRDVRLLLAVEDTITDGSRDARGERRLVSIELAFVELSEDGQARRAGPAPYLDYRDVKPDERDSVKALLSEQHWLHNSVIQRASGYAADHIVPAHLERVRAKTLARLDKVEAAVKKRLHDEIDQAGRQILKSEALRLEKKKDTSSQTAYYRRRLEELESRLASRISDLEAQRDLSSTDQKIVGAAVVIPAALLEPGTAAAVPDQVSADVLARKEIEMAAMQAVMEIERSLGYEPRDVSSENVGYDIESWIPEEKRGEEGAMLRFIEVKGRTQGADEVTVTRNELTTALNEPDQYVLAVVEVAPLTTHTTYMTRPFRNQPDFDAVRSTYSIRDLKRRAETVQERTLPR